MCEPVHSWMLLIYTAKKLRRKQISVANSFHSITTYDISNETEQTFLEYFPIWNTSKYGISPQNKYKIKSLVLFFRSPKDERLMVACR